MNWTVKQTFHDIFTFDSPANKSQLKYVINDSFSEQQKRMVNVIVIFNILLLPWKKVHPEFEMFIA